MKQPKSAQKWELPNGWQHDDIDKCLPFVRNFSRALDCGAHRGEVCKKLKKHFDHVTAIEPSHLFRQIEVDIVLNCAVGDTFSTCSIAEGNHNDGQRHVIIGNDVDVIPIDSLGQDFDFIKIDVEGYEYFALLGAEETIKRCKPVIMLEENGLNRRYNIPDNACKELLESWGAIHVLTIDSNYPDTDQVFAW